MIFLDYLAQDGELQEHINENEKIIEKYHRKINEIVELIKENSDHAHELHWSPAALDYRKMEEKEKRLCGEKKQALLDNTTKKGQQGSTVEEGMYL